MHMYIPGEFTGVFEEELSIVLRRWHPYVDSQFDRPQCLNLHELRSCDEAWYDSKLDLYNMTMFLGLNIYTSNVRLYQIVLQTNQPQILTQVAGKNKN